MSLSTRSACSASIIDSEDHYLAMVHGDPNHFRPPTCCSLSLKARRSMGDDTRLGIRSCTAPPSRTLQAVEQLAADAVG